MMRRAYPAILLAATISLAGAPRVRAQETEVLMPEQSSAKAKQLLQQAIEALGGSTYLNVRDITCTGQLAQFGHSGEVTGYVLFYDYSKPPDKDRTELSKKRDIIEVYNSNHGWVMDKGGVQDSPQDVIAQNQDDRKKDLDEMLRHRLNEPRMILRYAGPDVVDLQEADWVELVDSDGRTTRIALARSTHLPIRKVVITRDPDSRLRVEEIEYYSLYHIIDGVQTPFQIARERNGLKVYQVFLDECRYNTGLSDSLFTRESLQERWAKVGKKEKKKK